MNRKALEALGLRYLKALDYATFYHCDLSVDQFAAAMCLDPDEAEELREHLERKGVGV